MKILIGIISFLVLISPNLTFGSGSEGIPEVPSEIENLVECQLSDLDLSNLVGRGFDVSHSNGIEGANSKIILWDEAKSVVEMKDISTAYGNIQRNILSIQSR